MRQDADEHGLCQLRGFIYSTEVYGQLFDQRNMFEARMDGTYPYLVSLHYFIDFLSVEALLLFKVRF